jgi:hypothetical protein
MKSALTAWLAAACAVVGSGCTEPTKTQVLTGKVTTRDAIAVRAIDGDTVVTAARVRTDGSFTLQLPAGHRYRLEVLTASGVHNVVRAGGGAFGDLAFQVCEPTDPFDMGGFGEPGCDPMTDPECKPCGPNDPNCVPPPPCDANDPTCIPPCDPNDPMCVPPPPCDPNDPMCVLPPPCDPSDPNCMPPPPCDPSDPNCMPPPPCDSATDPDCKCYPGDPNCSPPCDPTTDPNCGSGGGGGTCDPNDPTCVPPPCDPTTDPGCKCYLASGNCEPPPPCDPSNPTCACQPGDPNCSTCDPMIDATCPTPPPPCEDPMDPNTCKDPCMVDPLSCGCGTDPGMMLPDGTTSNDNTCWPPPEPCTMESCPDDPWTPENPPGDFGCGGGTAGGGDTMTPVSEDGTL